MIKSNKSSSGLHQIKKRIKLASGEEQKASRVTETAGHNFLMSMFHSHSCVPSSPPSSCTTWFQLSPPAEVASSSHLQDFLICLQRVSSVHGFGTTKCTKMKTSTFFLFMKKNPTEKSWNAQNLNFTGVSIAKILGASYTNSNYLFIRGATELLSH